MLRRERLRSFLILAAKVAGAIGVVVLIVIVKPFVHSGQPSFSASLRPYVSGFHSPTFVGTAPGQPNRLYVVEQAGTIRYVERRRIEGTLLDIRARVGSGGERGLLSIAFSPNYEQDHLLYVNYTDKNGDTRVVEFRSRNGRAILGSARQLLFVDQPYPNHNGGQLQFGPDGLLYVGMGDGGAGGDPGNRAQNLPERLGKLLRIDPSKPGARWGRSSATACVIPGASRSIARTATSTSQTSASKPGRRSTSVRTTGSRRSRTMAGASTKGGRVTQPALRRVPATWLLRSASIRTRRAVR